MLDSKQGAFINLFSRGRHKNCSVIYMSQGYFRVPKTIRDNVSALMMFTCNSRERSMLYGNIGGELEKNAFDNMFTQLKKYEFCYIDHNPPMPELKYRKNFDQPYFL